MLFVKFKIFSCSVSFGMRNFFWLSVGVPRGNLEIFLWVFDLTSGFGNWWKISKILGISKCSENRWISVVQKSQFSCSKTPQSKTHWNAKKETQKIKWKKGSQPFFTNKRFPWERNRLGQLLTENSIILHRNRKIGFQR